MARCVAWEPRALPWHGLPWGWTTSKWAERPSSVGSDGSGPRSGQLDPTLFRVAVSDGVATITGRVQRRSTAEMIAPTVSMVPGIVDVRAEVTWVVDDSEFKPSAPEAVFPFGQI